MQTESVLVKPAQSRAGRGTSSIRLASAQPWGGNEQCRAYVKEQSDYCCRPAWRAWRRTPLLTREFRAITACRELGLAVPHILHYTESGTEATLVLAEITDAKPLQEALDAYPEQRWKILRNVAVYFRRLHDAGWYHGALYSPHILVKNSTDHGVFLIDFEKARRSRHRRIEDMDRFWRYNAYLPSEDQAIFSQIYGL